MLILRKKEKDPENDGIWVATSIDRHESLRPVLPSMRAIPLFGPGETAWQWLPESDVRFEEDALTACSLILKKDSRIGRIPKRKAPKKQKKKSDC